MNCAEFDRQWQELEDTSQVSAGMQQHLQSCHACSGMVEDVNRIAQWARQAAAMEEPSDQVWQRLRARLEREGLVRNRARSWRDVPVLRWFAPPLPMGLAYASVFFAALSVVYLHTVVTRQTTSPALTVAVQQTSTAPAVAPGTAAGNLVAAVPDRDKALHDLLQKIPAQKRATYEANLERVNTSIQNLETFVQSHPEDPFGRDQLLNAYQQKERLWENAVQWTEF